MFKVIHKETGEIVTVLGVVGLRFLLWDEEGNSWWFDSIDNYRLFGVQPMEGENV